MTHNRFNDGAFSAFCSALHFPASQAASFANRLEANRHGVTLFPTDETQILQAAERLEQAAVSLRETLEAMREKPITLRLVAAE